MLQVIQVGAWALTAATVLVMLFLVLKLKTIADHKYEIETGSEDKRKEATRDAAKYVRVDLEGLPSDSQYERVLFEVRARWRRLFIAVFTVLALFVALTIVASLATVFPSALGFSEPNTAGSAS